MSSYYANDDLGIDLSQVDENAGPNFELLPAGEYLMQANIVELVTSRAGHRQVKAEFVLIGGAHNGRRIWEYFGIEHPNSMAAAQRMIKKWVMACGGDANARLTMAMLQDLVGAEFVGKVTVEKSKDPNYSDKNQIKDFKPADIPFTAPVARPNPQPQPAAAANTMPPPAARQAAPKPSHPWERKA